MATGPTTGHPGTEPKRRWDLVVAPPRSLLRPAPRSAMFFPLAVIAAVLPGLYALNWWDLVPPGPWWGLRGLAVLDGYIVDQVPLSGLGAEGQAYRVVAFQPPLYAWLEAVCLRLSRNRDPLATVLPSYAAGALVVILVYLHGRLWLGRGVGLAAAILTAFNHELLSQMQQATPTTLGLAGALAGLLCYGHFLVGTEPRRRGWAVLGGAAVGASLMSEELLALWTVPIILLHVAVIAAEVDPRRPGVARWLRAVWSGPGFAASIVAIAVALVVAAPWHVFMYARYNGEFVLGLLGWASVTAPESLLATLLNLAPATLPLSVLATIRGVRQVLASEDNDPATLGTAFWVIWLAVAALGPALWPGGPRNTFALLMLVALNLLAARAIWDLAERRIPARSLIWLAPTTALCIAWWLSSDLRDAVADLSSWRRPDAASLLRLHLGLDLIVLLAVATRRLDHWARRWDGRRRMVLGGFLLGVLVVTFGSGLREVHFRHQETSDLLELREAILRRQRSRPFTLLAVVSPPSPQPAGRLRFLLRATLPYLSPLGLAHPDDLLALPESPDSQRLVLLVGTEQRLSYSLQSQLALEALYAASEGTMLEAFATSEPSGRQPARPATRSSTSAKASLPTAPARQRLVD